RAGRPGRVPGGGRGGRARPVHRARHRFQGGAGQADADTRAPHRHGGDVMTTVERPRIVGAGADRVDGPLKVTRAAPYPNDFSLPGMAHAAVVRATIAAGRIARLDNASAERAPGVLADLTHLNAPRLGTGPESLLRTPPPPLQDDRILYYGQYVAVVVADTPERAVAAARRVEVGYDRAEPLLDLDDPRAERVADPWGSDASWGDPAAGLARADVVVD